MDLLAFLVVSSLLLGAFQVPFAAGQGPYAVRIGCGSTADSYGPNGFIWQKDFGYSGGSSANCTLNDPKAPQLNSVRYFQLSDGAENCYNITVPPGHYLIRMYFAYGQQDNSGREPQFDVSIEGTLVYSMLQGWSQEPENNYQDSLAYVTDGAATVCFHSSGHGNPAIASLEILQIFNNAYRTGGNTSQDLIWRTVKRVSAGADKSGFGSDFFADPWGGDRYWETDSSLFLPGSIVHPIVTTHNITNVATYPNIYPMAIFQSATATDPMQTLSYTLPVDPNRNYTVWIYLAELSPYIVAKNRVFDILVNGQKIFASVDIVAMAPGAFNALILNATVLVETRTLTLTFNPLFGNIAVNAFEVYELIPMEAKTLNSNVWALQSMKQSLGLPARLGWNGDPCVPQAHPWFGIDCGFDANIGAWFIDGLSLDSEGLQGVIGEEIGTLSGLQALNMSNNELQGPIPATIGNLTALVSLDLSHNRINGSIPAILGTLPNIRKVYLNNNQLSGVVPSSLGAGALHGANINFANNDGLCGVGLGPCTQNKKGTKAGIAIGILAAIVVLSICGFVYWKRRANIARAQRLPRDAPYAKARTTFVRDVQLARTVLSDHFKPVYRDPVPPTQSPTANLL